VNFVITVFTFHSLAIHKLISTSKSLAPAFTYSRILIYTILVFFEKVYIHNQFYGSWSVYELREIREADHGDRIKLFPFFNNGNWGLIPIFYSGRSKSWVLQYLTMIFCSTIKAIYLHAWSAGYKVGVCYDRKCN
jgi:hypothetical protein